MTKHQDGYRLVSQQRTDETDESKVDYLLVLKSFPVPNATSPAIAYSAKSEKLNTVFFHHSLEVSCKLCASVFDREYRNK
jgi:hypothetical protein